MLISDVVLISNVQKLHDGLKIPSYSHDSKYPSFYFAALVHWLDEAVERNHLDLGTMFQLLAFHG